jgi:hypothetical protein
VDVPVPDVAVTVVDFRAYAGEPPVASEAPVVPGSAVCRDRYRIFADSVEAMACTSVGVNGIGVLLSGG